MPLRHQPAAALEGLFEAGDEDSRLVLPEGHGFVDERFLVVVEELAGQVADPLHPPGRDGPQRPRLEPRTLGAERHSRRLVPLALLQHQRQLRPPANQLALDGGPGLPVIDPGPDPLIELPRVFVRQHGHDVGRPVPAAMIQGVGARLGLAIPGLRAGAFRSVLALDSDRCIGRHGVDLQVIAFEVSRSFYLVQSSCLPSGFQESRR